jgi:S1-C subfamily serine protease
MTDHMGTPWSEDADAPAGPYSGAGTGAASDLPTAGSPAPTSAPFPPLSWEPTIPAPAAGTPPPPPAPPLPPLPSPPPLPPLPPPTPMDEPASAGTPAADLYAGYGGPPPLSSPPPAQQQPPAHAQWSSPAWTGPVAGTAGSAQGFSGSTAAPWPPVGTPDASGYAATAVAAPPRGKRGRTALLAAAAAVLLCAAGAGGAAIALAVDHPGTSPSATGSTNAGGPGASTAAINVSSIAACVDPAVVDLRTSTGAGTGMVLTSDGIVLTNNHVVSAATSIAAQIDGTGRTYKVDVLGVDPTADVALVRLEGASNLPTVHLGSSSDLAIGDQVVAIGNALNLTGPPTVTQGDISALDRSISASDPGTGTSENLSGLIQTDASINPGNSGGPLVDGRCQVIGMNTAAATGSAEQSVSNIGFAIPVNTAAAIVQRVESGQGSAKVVLGERAYVGVAVFSVAEAESPEGLTGPTGAYTSPVATGAVVANTVPGLPASAAGIQAGDVIVSFDGSKVASPADLERLIGLTRPYRSAEVGWVDLGGTHQTATLTLAMVPVK